MGIKTMDSAFIQNKNPICILNTGHTLSNDDFRGPRNICLERFSYFGIGRRIHSAGGIIQNQNLRLLQKRSGNTKSLFLSARYIRSAPLNPSMVSIRKAVNKF